MGKLGRMLEKLTRTNIHILAGPIALVVGFGLFILVVIADYVTTFELSLTPFYLFIVLLVTWNSGWKWGLGFSILSFAVQVALGLTTGHPYSEAIYFYIDNANRLISYLVAWRLISALKVQHEREKNSARRDYLTDLANQKGFYEALGVEMARHRRDNNPMSIAFLDCDNFKEVNDGLGHKEGDRLLKNLARTMSANLRKTDVVGRLGGDEFAIVLSKTDKDQAIHIIGKLRQELDAAMAQHNWPVTFSIGLGIFASVPESEDEMISFTDKLMYRVKSTGKNNVMTEEFKPA
jgi:diguanylate cyclase (GGDEF)-like protein